MIEIIPTQEQIERAKARFEFGKLKNSITGGEGNLIGALGEIIVIDYFASKYGREYVQPKNTFDYDVVMNGHTVDVKTKKCTSPPLHHYNVSVAKANTRQNCSFYCFVRILENHSKAWILGFMNKRKFYEQATFGKKGQPDPMKPEFTFRDDCYNIEIFKLSI